MDPPQKNFLGEQIYRLRVGILLVFFLLAMVANSRHPHPLWVAILAKCIGARESGITPFLRHVTLLVPLGLYTLALLLRLSASSSLGGRTIWAKSPVTDVLTQEGLFAHIRHPLYAGSAGMIVSLSLMSSPQGAAILVGGGLPFLAFLARFEEKILLARFPEYSEYKTRVPAFIPTKFEIKKGWNALFAPLHQRLGRSLRSEAFNVALLAGFGAFWASPTLPLFWISFSLGLALAFTAPFWAPERNEASS